MKKALLSLLCILAYYTVSTQHNQIELPTAINIDGDPPQESALLDVQSTESGILIPRMTTSQRNAISSPALGLLVYDRDFKAFYYFDGIRWISLSTHLIADRDTDTWISTEQSADEDMIRVSVRAQEVMTLSESEVKLDDQADFLIGDMITGEGEKLLYNASIRALRFGSLNAENATNWDPSNMGLGSLAFGLNTKATRNNAFAMGSGSEALGVTSVALGFNTIAEGNQSTAWGNGSHAEGRTSTAWGRTTVAFGEEATAWGTRTEASADRSTSWGQETTASGISATAWGEGNTANSYAETVIGLYATEDTGADPEFWVGTDRIFTIGNGGDEERSDALTVFKNGDAIIHGDNLEIGHDDGQVSLTLNADGGSTILFEEAGATAASIEWNPLTNLLAINDDINITKDKVGIGRVPQDFSFEVNGKASKDAPGEWLGHSDCRLKKNIHNLDSKDALSIISEMQGVSYEWNDQATGITRPEGPQIGFIAQDLQEILPDKVKPDSNGYLQTAFGELDPLFVEAIKAQQAEITELRSIIHQLQIRLETIENIKE